MMTMTMTKPAAVATIILWLLGFHGRITLTDGFSHTKQSSTPILVSGRDHGRQLRLRSVGLDDMPRRGEGEIIDDVGSSSCSRRLFVVSLFGAASMLAFSEGVAADSTDSWQEPIQFTSSTIETSTTITALKNDAVASAATSSSTIDTRGIIQKAAKKALSGGKAGAAAAVVQVLSLMWLRTSMNYQYRFGERLSEISCFCMES